MKRIFFLSTTVLTISAIAYVDFGFMGNTEPVGETRDYEKSLEDFNATRAKEQFLASIKTSMEGNISLPRCDKNSTREFDYGLTLSKDYVMNGFTLAKKGTRINPLAKIPFLPTIIIADGSRQTDIEILRSIYPDKVIFMLNKGNVMEFEKQYSLEATLLYPAFEKTFSPRCTPSVYIKNGDKFLVKEYFLEKNTTAVTNVK
ncbi:MAG: hypothetical protein PHE67_00695 [Campylobacterales bacterium]|nr:hypothetical protein [Campylobacterales bacterium]